MVTTGAARGHGGGNGGDQDVGRPDIHGEHRVEIGVGQLLGQACRVDVGVVDEDVDPATEGGSGVHGEVAKVAVGAGQIGCHENRVAAGGCDVIDHSLSALDVVQRPGGD